MQKKFRLIITLLVLSIVIFISYNIYDLANKNSENQYNKLINDLNKDTTDFSSWISNKKAVLKTAKDVVDNFSFDEIVRWNTLNPYLNINNDDPDISQIYIGLANGEFITGGQWVPPDDYDPRTRIWYREAVEADDTIISDVYIDRESGDKTVTISSPLYMDGRFVGVISADLFLNDISDWLAKQISGKNIYTYLMNSEGTIIIHTLRPELVGTNAGTDPGLYESTHSRQDLLYNYFQEVRTTSRIVRMEYVVDGKKIKGIIRKIEDGNWFLAVAAVEDHNILNFMKLNRNSIIFNLLMLGIVLLLLLLVIRIKHELEKKNQLLTIDNERDFLTGVFNRRYFNLYMENLWNTPDSSSVISLLMMDIDHFKGYNDTYGHIEGDKVLKSVTQAINNTIRKQDVLARYGGEEFVLVLEGVSVEHAGQIAEKVVDVVYERNIENSSSPIGRITISVGVASVHLAEKSEVRQFINRADKALYRAKESGRNTLVVSLEKE